MIRMGAVLLSISSTKLPMTSGVSAVEHRGALACGLWRNAGGVAQVAVGSGINYGSEKEASEVALAQCRDTGVLARACKEPACFSADGHWQRRNGHYTIRQRMCWISGRNRLAVPRRGW
jgi:hypothetical protein